MNWTHKLAEELLERRQWRDRVLRSRAVHKAWVFGWWLRAQLEWPGGASFEDVEELYWNVRVAITRATEQMGNQ